MPCCWDAALPDAAVSVPAHAASLGVPVVAFTFRAADLEISPSLRIFNVRSLRSTDFMTSARRRTLRLGKRRRLRPSTHRVNATARSQRSQRAFEIAPRF